MPEIPTLPPIESLQWYPWAQGVDINLREALLRLTDLDGGSITTPPGAPETLTAKLVGTTATLTWTEPGNTGGSAFIGVQYGRDGYDQDGGPAWSSEILPASQRSAPLYSLVPGATYKDIWVRYYNSKGAGEKKSIILTLPDLGPANNLLAAQYDAGPDLTKFSLDGTGVTLETYVGESAVGSSSLRTVYGSGAVVSSGPKNAVSVPVTALKTYTFLVTMTSIDIDSTFIQQLKWRKADGTSLSNFSGVVTTFNAGDKKILALTGTAPSGAASVFGVVRQPEGAVIPSGGKSHLTDAWSIVESAAVIIPVTGTNMLPATMYEASDASMFEIRGALGTAEIPGVAISITNEWAGSADTSVKWVVNSTGSRSSGIRTKGSYPATAYARYDFSVHICNGNFTLPFFLNAIWLDSAGVVLETKQSISTRIIAGADAIISMNVMAPPRAASVYLGISCDTESKPATGSYAMADQFISKFSAAAPSNTYVSEILDYVRPVSDIFTDSSEWRRDVSNAPLHPNSTILIQKMVDEQIKPNYSGISILNTEQYNSTLYVVGPNHPRINIGFCDAQKKSYTPGELYAKDGVTGLEAFMDVPMPLCAISGAGGDRHLTIWQPSTDTLWEFWQCLLDRQVSRYGGVTPARAKAGSFSYQDAATIGNGWGGWSATWGGRLDNVSTAKGWFPGGTGCTATGLAVGAGGSVGVKEAQAGVIDHALGVSMIGGDLRPYTVWSYPARRSDGAGPNSTDLFAEGQRLRLDPSVNVDAITGMTPIGRMIAKAAQKYGFIITDKSGGVEIETEAPDGLVRMGQSNPWDAILGSVPAYQAMKNFPWSRMQAIAYDYGKAA